jgi:ABC-2 type transport system permease protein
MRKLFVLAIKEVLVTFRDLGAIVTMLLTPLLLTLAIAAAFGTGGDAALTDIPVLVENRDTGQLSQEIITAFEDQQVEGLLDVRYITDAEEARQKVENGQVAAFVVIPEDFSKSVLPLVGMVETEMGLDLFSMEEEDYQALTPEQQEAIGRLFAQSQEGEQTVPVIEIYASSEFQISTSVIQGIIRSVLERMNMTIAGTNIIINRMVESSARSGEDPGLGFSDFGASGESGGMGSGQELPIDLEIVSPSGRSFNWLDYSAASMAILFLMFAVTTGGRTLLAERQDGTLPRLITSPTRSLTILLGKMAGIVLTGLLQVFLLWGATSLIGAYWGEPSGVILTILCLVLAATSVGALISTFAKNAGQAGAIGTAFSLIAAAASGSFFPRSNLPELLQTISFVTPNAWGIEIFGRLQSGQSLTDILPMLGGLLALSIVYYTIAAFGFRRQMKG